MHYDFINVITFISIKVEEWSVSISYILTLYIEWNSYKKFEL